MALGGDPGTRQGIKRRESQWVGIPPTYGCYTDDKFDQTAGAATLPISPRLASCNLLDCHDVSS